MTITQVLQERAQKLLRIESFNQVVRYAGYVTALAVFSSVLVVGLATYWTHWRIFLLSISIAGAIPLLIAPPLALLVLYVLWQITRAIDQINDFIRYDPLTGVLTRGYFLDLAQRAFYRGGFFFMLDIDHFKKINDDHGHDIGDEALRVFAAAIKSVAQDDWLIGRLGGEEFGLFVPGAGLATATVIGDKICAAVRNRGEYVAGKRIGLTVSIGCSACVVGQSLDDLMKTADMRLYDAKRSGRNRYVIDGLSTEWAHDGGLLAIDPARNTATLTPA
jgi:diguanylate cyclase (GGDEF)-like protein